MRTHFFCDYAFFHPDFVRIGLDDSQNDRISDGNIGKFNVHDRMVLEAIQQNSYFTVAQLVSQLGISESTIRRAIRKLRTNGLIQREGANKNGKWVVLK